MTPDPEMTYERAREVLTKGASFTLEKDKPYKIADIISLHEQKNGEFWFAKGFLSGHAAGVKESQALVKELVAALKACKEQGTLLSFTEAIPVVQGRE